MCVCTASGHTTLLTSCTINSSGCVSSLSCGARPENEFDLSSFATCQTGKMNLIPLSRIPLAEVVLKIDLCLYKICVWPGKIVLAPKPFRLRSNGATRQNRLRLGCFHVFALRLRVPNAIGYRKNDGVLGTLDCVYCYIIL